MSVATTAPQAQWRDQHVTYGAQFASIYDRLFPASDATSAVDRLVGLVPAGATLAEYGVGTGRVAVPAAQRGVVVHGVDSSAELLAIAASRRAERIVLHEGDIREWTPPSPVDLAYCVCATISMQPGRDDQARVLERLATAITADGVVVVETHNPGRVRALHSGQEVVEFTVDVPGIDGGVRCQSRLTGDWWALAHSWHEDGEHHAQEFSLLTSPQQLDELAAPVGLRIETLQSSWDGLSYREDSPTYIAVLRKIGHSKGGAPR